jgi:osmotically-inducible protein OsmY
MNTRWRELKMATCACVVPLIFGLGDFASPANAQNMGSMADGRSTTSVASNSQDADSRNAELQQRVAAALESEPYLDDEHINISVHGGVVVLSGIVFSGWQLQDALRTARKAARGGRVVDGLSIEEGGR